MPAELKTGEAGLKLPPRTLTKTPASKMTVTGIRIPAALWLQCRFHALMNGISATELTATALRQYLESAGHKVEDTSA